MKVETKGRAPPKSMLESEKKLAYVVHRKPTTKSMMQASNDTFRNCKETLILTVEVSGRVFLECIHIRVQTVNRINIWLMKIGLKVTRPQALED